MKIINLLNKIANCEEVPDEIFFKNKTFIFDGARYLTNNGDEELTDYLAEDGLTSYCLNDEVKIIEEDKKIEEIKWNEKSLYNGNTTRKLDKMLMSRTEQLKKDLNKLIDEVNKFKED